MDQEIVIRLADRADWDTLVAMVHQTGLPTSDLMPGVQQLWGAWAGEKLRGVIGAEVHGATVLVRSLAVDSPYRGQGIAGKLFSHLQTWWGIHGPLVVLTETAETFFAKHGFQVVNRNDLPEEVKASAEFQELCPLSAKAMVHFPG